MFNELKQSLPTEANNLDHISIVAPTDPELSLPSAFALESPPEGDLPGGHPPEKKRARLSDDDEYSDLIPRRQAKESKSDTVLPTESLLDDFFNLVDQEMPTNQPVSLINLPHV